MPYKENLARAAALKAELDSLRPLTAEMEQRIMQKFRLDWNYHSSHIEGNQLTYGETKALILFGHTAQAKPLKDHLEMTGHDEAIKQIEEVIRQERPLTESFIRELHTLILKEPYERPAQTADGIPTVRRIAVGEYKTSPNHVLTRTGEMFYFASPEETPAKMAELMAWYNENVNKEDTNAVLFATEFHYRFIRIHPFDDGNGRLARLLMNFILMLKGYPPAIIKTEDKDAYYNALQQADAENLDFFFNYLCEQLIRSLEIMIKGAKGEDVDEDDDLDKKLALLKQKLNGVDKEKEIKLKYNRKTFLSLYDRWIKDIVKVFVETVEKYNDFYLECNHSINLSSNGQGIVFTNQSFENTSERFINMLGQSSQGESNQRDELTLQCSYRKFRKGGVNTFDSYYTVRITFTEIAYQIDMNGWAATSVRLLHEPFEEIEKKNFARKLGNDLLKQIEDNIAKLN
jgi:Fic family protein